MDELVANLVKAYEIRIKNLEWMSDATKQKALDKLHALHLKSAIHPNGKPTKVLILPFFSSRTCATHPAGHTRIW